MPSKGQKEIQSVSVRPEHEIDLRGLAEQSQLNFELEFFGPIMDRCPDFVDVLRVMGNNLTTGKRYEEGLEVDRRLVRLKPDDPVAHYNMACSFALLNNRELAFRTLFKAVELGYRDFEHMMCDPDLTSLHEDDRFLKIIESFEEPPVRSDTL